MSIRKRAKGQYQVRVRPFGAQTVPTKEAAEKLELDLMLRRSMGDLYEEAPHTLVEELDAFEQRKKALGGRRGPLTARGIEFVERSGKLWRKEPLASTTLPALRRAAIEDVIARRAAAHPRSAKNELEHLKAVLREARSRGQRVEPAIFDIPPVGHEPRSGRALTVDALYELSSWFPEHVRRLVLLAGRVGARQHFWFGLRDDMLDLDEGAISIHRSLAKNRRDHRVFLTPEEVTLLREQLVARAGRTRLVFPTVTGRPWTRSGFRQRVWVDAIEAAAAGDREKNGVEDSVFDGFTFHLLRHTAGSLMALAGMDPAVASERLGHTDGGALFLRTYRHLYEGEKRVQAQKLEDLVKRELRRAETERA